MRVVIIGNSGAARECYWLLRLVQEADKSTPPFKGFLAWNGYAGQLCELEHLSLGDAETYTPEPGDLFVIGIGKPALRMEVHGWLVRRHLELFTLKHPDVYICPSASMGTGNIFQRDCVVQANATIGNANYFNGGIIVGHDAAIGDGNTFNLRTAISGHARIGDGNQFAPQCMVLEHAKIGNWNVFAPGTAIYKGCRDHCLMAGNPALVERRSCQEGEHAQPRD